MMAQGEDKVKSVIMTERSLGSRKGVHGRLGEKSALRSDLPFQGFELRQAMNMQLLRPNVLCLTRGTADERCRIRELFLHLMEDSTAGMLLTTHGRLRIRLGG
jgi:hypothetical protein